MPRKTPPKRPVPTNTPAPRANRPPVKGEDERIAVRRASAFRLRVAGKSYRAIADQLGVSVHTAWDDVAAELNELRDQTHEDVTAVREMEIERCDQLWTWLRPRLERGDPQAVASAIKVMDRRSKLLGLDASTKIDLGGKLTLDTTLTDAVRSELDRFAALHAGSGSLPSPLDQ